MDYLEAFLAVLSIMFGPFLESAKSTMLPNGILLVAGGLLCALRPRFLLRVSFFRIAIRVRGLSVADFARQARLDGSIFVVVGIVVIVCALR